MSDFVLVSTIMLLYFTYLALRSEYRNDPAPLTKGQIAIIFVLIHSIHVICLILTVTTKRLLHIPDSNLDPLDLIRVIPSSMITSVVVLKTMRP